MNIWKGGKGRSTGKKKMHLFVVDIRSNIFIQFWDCHVVKENVRKVSEKVLNAFVGGENWFCWSALEN